METLVRGSQWKKKKGVHRTPEIVNERLEGGGDLCAEVAGGSGASAALAAR